MDKVLSLFQNNSYQDVFPMIEPMEEINLFIRVSTYDIILPTAKRVPPPVNIFEETALRFLALNKGYTETAIAELMCVKRELAGLLIMRLKEFGYIDEELRLTGHGEALLKGWAQESKPAGVEANLNAHIFAVKGTQELLSYVHVGEIQGERIVFRDDRQMSIAFGSAGEERKYQAKGLYVNEFDRQAARFRQSDLRRLLSRYNRLCGETGYEPAPFLDNYMIDITKGPDVILHCKAIIQKGYADSVLVSDGFTAGSDVLTKFVGKYAFVKRRLQERAVYRQTEQESGRAEPKRDRYWQLRRCLGRKRSVGEDHDESLEAARNDRKDIQDFFTAVEWAFHFTLRKNSVPENLIKVMMSQSPEENRELLLMMARKLDIRFDGNSIFLISNLDRKRIAAYRRSGVPALYTVLPLAVVSAAENGGGVARLAANMPDFPQWLWDLSLKSGKFRHEIRNETVPQEYYEEMTRRTAELVGWLLPDFSLEESGGERIAEGASRRRLNAQVELSRTLGWELYEQLDEGLKEELRQISPDKNDFELPPPLEYVLTLSKILENILGDIAVRRRWQDRRQVIAEIEHTHGVKLADGIGKMQERYFINAMNGGKTTLNGRLAAFLYGASPERAKPLIELGLTGD